jgi:hypothetical protein
MASVGEIMWWNRSVKSLTKGVNFYVLCIFVQLTDARVTFRNKRQAACSGSAISRYDFDAVEAP